MDTPIYDFVEAYRKSNKVRLHMPGHKGVCGPLGIEDRDITEIDGADELYRAEGIIAASERNAGRLFGADTFYSAEGSSLAIRAMLYLTVKWAAARGQEPLILAARNVHKTYINTAALLDIETQWIMGRCSDPYEVCRVTAEELADILDSGEKKPIAVYVTSPDYLGHMADIAGMAQVCHARGILLLVDDAHGAYLKFLQPSRHPMDLGADMCADSAHKTLPVLTGGAYLHISCKADPFFAANAEEALQLFGSTSPSYLIMQSLDLANPYLGTFTDRLDAFIPEIKALKDDLEAAGYSLISEEPLKITIDAEKSGMDGRKLAEDCIQAGLIPEFYDECYVVFMLTPQNSADDLKRIRRMLVGSTDGSGTPGSREESRRNHDMSDKRSMMPSAGGLKSGHNVTDRIPCPEQVMTAREAMLAESELLPADQCIGRVLAEAAVSCPPAVPVFMLGERIDRKISYKDMLRVVIEEK